MGDLAFPWKPSWEEIYILGQGWSGRRDEGVLTGSVVTWASKGREHPNQKPVPLVVKKRNLGMLNNELFAFRPYQDGSWRTVVRHYLNAKPTDPARGIFVTVNGQTHALMLSTKQFLLLQERLETGRRVGAFQEATTRWSSELPRVRRSGPLAWVQIMTGCTNYCSYCIVPYVRGPEASRPAGAIIEEVRWELDAAGYPGVGIFLSGGVTREDVVSYRDIVDAFGIGGAIANAPVIDFAMDIVERDGVACAKRGKRSGVKQVYLLPGGEHRMQPASQLPPPEGVPLLRHFIKNGTILLDSPMLKILPVHHEL